MQRRPCCVQDALPTVAMHDPRAQAQQPADGSEDRDIMSLQMEYAAECGAISYLARLGRCCRDGLTVLVHRHHLFQIHLYRLSYLLPRWDRHLLIETLFFRFPCCAAIIILPRNPSHANANDYAPRLQMQSPHAMNAALTICSTCVQHVSFVLL